MNYAEGLIEVIIANYMISIICLLLGHLYHVQWITELGVIFAIAAVIVQILAIILRER